MPRKTGCNLHPDLAKFAEHMKSKMGAAMVRKYVKGKGMKGAGKKHINDMLNMKGGSWGDFTNWVKGAANKVAGVANKVAGVAKTVYNKALKPGAQLLYKHGIKPAYDYIRQTISTVAKVAKYAGYDSAGNAIQKVADKLGKGKRKRGKGPVPKPLPLDIRKMGAVQVGSGSEAKMRFH